MGKEMAVTGSGEIARQSDVEESAQMARAQAEIQAALVVADRRPRNEMAARQRMIQSVDRSAFAEAAYYTYPRKKKGGGKVEIFGPSINLAREMKRLWGNIRSGYHTYDSADGQRTIAAFAWDLETNAYEESQDCFKKLIQRFNYETKVTTWVEPDERDLRELTERRAAVQARNCILRLMPRDVVDELVTKARQVVKGTNGGKSLGEKIKDAVDVFESLGVYVADIEAHFDCEMVRLTDDDLVELRGIYQAIKDDASKRDEYFPRKREPKANPVEDDDAPMNLPDIMNGKVVEEENPHEKEYPPDAQMRVAIINAIKARVGDDPKSVEAALKIARVTQGQTDITLIKGEMLRALYDKEVRRA